MPTATVFEPWPGTYLVKCTVSFGVGSGGGNAQTVDSNTLVITVLKPDGFKVTSGLKVPADNNSTITVVYTITCGGTTSNGNVGTAQELITNKTAPYSTPTHPPDDPAWTPAASSPTFYLSGGSNFICDLKGTYLGSTNWSTIPVGAVFYTFTQNNQIIMSDACGNTNTYPLGSVKLQRRKVSATQWQIELQ